MTLIAQMRTNTQCSAGQAFSVISNMERFGEWFRQIELIVKESVENQHFVTER